MHSYRARQSRPTRPPPSREAEYKLISDTVNDICFAIKNYAQKFLSQKSINYKACLDGYRALSKQWKLDPTTLQNWKEFMERLKTDKVDSQTERLQTFEDLVNLCERSKEFEIMIPHVRERLVTCAHDHVYKYCLSFAEEAGGVDARPVLEYEDTIRNYRKEIEAKITAINADILRYSEVKSPFEKFIIEGGNIGTLMETICVQIVETAHSIKKWVSDDASYPDKLHQEITFNISYREKLQEDVTALAKRRSSLERSLDRKSKLMRRLEKDYTLHRKEKRRRVTSLQTVNGKVEKLEFQLAQKGEAIEGTRTALSSLKVITPRMEDEYHVKMEKDMKESDRIQEWLSVMQRQRMRLERELKEVSDRTYELKVEFVENKQQQEELQHSLFGVDLELSSLQERLQAIDRKTAVLKHVRLLKMSPETLRKLYRRRREYYKQAQLLEACRFVAQNIGLEWKKLYERLPFDPNRNSDKLVHDIDLIDMISARRDQTLEEQALQCLEKWRTFNRKTADVAQLIRGLRRLHRLDLADSVEMRFSMEDVYG